MGRNDLYLEEERGKGLGRWLPSGKAPPQRGGFYESAITKLSNYLIQWFRGGWVCRDSSGVARAGSDFRRKVWSLMFKNQNNLYIAFVYEADRALA